MIEHNVIELLLSLLEDEDCLSDYALEYAVALLMNLCLRTSGKLRCTRDPHAPLKVLINLLGSQNQEVRLKCNCISCILYAVFYLFYVVVHFP